MKNKKNGFTTDLIRCGWYSLLLSCSLLIVLGSCRSEMDKHYKDYSSAYNNGLWEQITNKAEDSVFVRLVKRAKLEKLITDNSTLTLWIPTNEACAKLNNLSDDALKSVLMYHMSVSVSQLDMVSDTIKVQTLLGKYLTFVRSNGSYSSGEVQVLKMNELAKNGIIHQLSNALNPMLSIMEYMEANKDKYSMIYKEIVQYNKTYNDLAHSVKTGFNDNGQSVYDTVKVRTNSFLSKIGDYYAENSSLTVNLASDKMFLQALNDHVYPYFTNRSGFDVSTDTFFVTKLIDSVLINNTFLNGIIYTPGKNILQRAYVDNYLVKVGGLLVPVSYHKSVIVKSESVDSMKRCSNGLAYIFKDVDIQKKWFAYPFGKLAHTYRTKFVDSLSYKTPIASKGTITIGTKKTNGKTYESYDAGRMEWFEASDSFIEYKVDVLPMRYKLVRECNTFYTGTVQAMVSYNNDINYTNVGDPFDNSVFASNPADNSGLTSLTAGWGRWVTPLTFTKPGTVKIRFTCTSGTAANVHVIYLVPMD
jgi:uncharacterized surface protein with fasciclin (FAS1) repeats